MNIKLYLFIAVLIWSACGTNRKIKREIKFKSEYKFSAEIEQKVKLDTVPWKYQISAADYATKGDYKNALIHWDLAMTPGIRTLKPEQIDSINIKYVKTDAVEFIVDQAKKHQVVIINEAHHNSMHRAFTRSLLKRLYDIGYKNLGLEALGNGKFHDSAIHIRKYPLLHTGYYIKDPQFGNMVREALETGYRIFPYEVISNANGKPREIEQAQNIKRVIDSRPNEKFLIHCGFDHALEGIHNSWEKAMAGRLTEYTGIDPFTINQVVYSEKSKPGFNPVLLKALDLKRPTVLLDSTNNPLRYEREKSWMDIAVLHPITSYIHNRPHWLFDNENKKVAIQLDKIKISFPVMILAYRKGEDIANTVPVDIIEVATKSDACVLALKKGEYQIVVTNGAQTFTFERIVK